MKTSFYCLITLLIIVLGGYSCKKDPDAVNPVPGTESLYFPPHTGTAWETSAPEDLGWDVSKIPDLLQFLEEGKTRAFMVLKNGKIVIEEYFGKALVGSGDFNASSNWYWASAGKTLTAFTVGLAQEDGYLDIEDRSSDYLGAGWAAITAEQEQAITVRNHLTMTTGLDDKGNNSDCTDPECLVYRAAPGTRWAYHNAPYTILDQVIEGATQQSFDNYFHSRLTSRIGMDGFWSYLDYNHVYFSTARSMARFGLLNLNGGKWENDVVMGKEQYFSEMTNTSQDINQSYGYLWWLNGKSSYYLPGLQIKFNGSLTPGGPADMFSGVGKNGQIVSVVPSQGLVMVRMGENPDNALVPNNYFNELWEKLDMVIK